MMTWSAAIQAVVAFALGGVAAIAAVNVRMCGDDGCHWSPLLGGGAGIVCIAAGVALASALVRRSERPPIDLLVITVLLAVIWVAAFGASLAHYGT